MSLFPRAFQEFSPFLTLINDYDKAARAMTRDAFADLPDATFFRPKFDVKELKDSYELHGELPGLEQKDVNIEWTDSNTLTISGRTETRREEGTPPKQLQARVEDEDEPEQQSTAVTKTEKAGEVAKSEEGPKYWLSERSVGEFRRNFSFPARVDQDAVKASLKNGVLSIVVPKATGSKNKKITIE
jgi:HSP20 family protein